MIEETVEMKETRRSCKCSQEVQVFKRHEKSSLGSGFVTCEASETELETLCGEIVDPQYKVCCPSFSVARNL